MGDVASWVEAIGTVGAVAAAVFLWRADRKHERNEAARSDKERVERMLVALKAEINGAITVARRQKFTIERTLAQVSQAQQAGAEIRTSGRFSPDAMSVTDAVVYRALAPELGRLPAALIQHTTEFFIMARELERLAMLGGDAMVLYKSLADLLPRFLFHGEWTVRIFDRFVASNCSADANLQLGRDELLALAKANSYPIEEVARERGIKL